MRRHRLEIILAEMMQAELDGLGHAAGGRTVVLRKALRKVIDQVLIGPAADPGCSVRCDVVGMPTGGHCARELLAIVESVHRVARRVTFAAMPERLDQVGAMVLLRRTLRVRLELPARQEKQFPGAHKIALIVWKAQLVFRSARM